MNGGDIWTAYYDEFSYFSTEGVRDGCEPRTYLHPQPADKAVVLVHGLSDSPHFMRAIAEFFHETLGYDVYLPLLHGHGLREPKGMEDVELSEWKKNVSWAVKQAGERTDHLSIGGLSTGGVLSFFTASYSPRITGALYLFSAALDLHGGPKGFIGELKERIPLLPFIDNITDSSEPLATDKKLYRYMRVDIDGAKQLAHLLRETDSVLDAYDEKHPYPKPVFAGHSEADTTADITGIETLQKDCPSDRFDFFRMKMADGISHASVVLRDSIVSSDPGTETEKANPRFAEMMKAVQEFEAKHA